THRNSKFTLYPYTTLFRSAPVALLFALFTVTAAILQGINEQRFALVSLFAGFLIKVLFNSVLIHAFAGKGSIFATGLAVGVAVLDRKSTRLNSSHVSISYA